MCPEPIDLCRLNRQPIDIPQNRAFIPSWTALCIRLRLCLHHWSRWICQLHAFIHFPKGLYTHSLVLFAWQCQQFCLFRTCLQKSNFTLWKIVFHHHIWDRPYNYLQIWFNLEILIRRALLFCRFSISLYNNDCLWYHSIIRSRLVSHWTTHLCSNYRDYQSLCPFLVCSLSASSLHNKELHSLFHKAWSHSHF